MNYYDDENAIPVRGQTGYVPSYGQPANSIRTTPDPMGGLANRGPADPKAQMAIEEMRKRRARDDAAMKGPAIEVGPHYGEDRGGGAYQGADRFRYTGKGSLSKEQFTDVMTGADADQSYVDKLKGMDAVFNGQHYHYTPRVRIGDDKAQLYLQDAKSRREFKRQEDLDRQAAIDKRASDQNLKTDKFLTAQREDFAEKDAFATHQRDEDRKDRTFRMDLAGKESEQALTKAKTDRAIYENTTEGRNEGTRRSMAETFLKSTDPKLRAYGANIIGSEIGAPDLGKMVGGTYEEKKAVLEPLIKDYKESITSGYGAHFGEGDASAAQQKMQAIWSRAQQSGMTPEELQTLHAELQGMKQGQGFLPQVWKTITGDW